MERALTRSIDRVSTGRIGRVLKMSRLAVGGGSRILAGKAKSLLGGSDEGLLAGESGLALAADILSTVSELRGLAMKVGQMLSYIDDGLPPEVRRLLAVLQRDAPPMSTELVRKRLEEELGKPIESAFAELEDKPMAAASIGQVHRARLLDGTAVAVKIQYPGIEDAMSADLKNAKVAGLFKQALFVNTDLRAVMRELEERLMDECDYTKEADYQEAFCRRFEGHPWIRIPAVHRELTTKRVLVTTLCHGKHYYEWLATNPSDEERAKVARTIYRFYLGSLYLDGLFNCDPHPGNYLFPEDGTMVFLDFGCVRRFEDRRRRAWIEMACAVRSDDPERIHRAGLEVGFFAPDTSYDRAAFRDLIRYLYEPYLESGPYDFRRHRPQQTFRAMFLDNRNLFKLNMPPDAVFLNRITFGLVSLMTDIGAPVDCQSLAEAYFNRRDPDWPDDPHLR